MRLHTHWLLWTLLLVLGAGVYSQSNGIGGLLLLAVVLYGIVLLVWSAIALLGGMCRALWQRIRWSSHEREIRERDANTESPLELALAHELDRAGISYVREYQISRVHVDFAFPEAKLAVECDGWRYHHANKVRDHRRDAFLKSRGWRVVRFTGEQLRADAPGCARRIAELL